MEKFRTSKTRKITIEVNDQGETITLDLADQSILLKIGEAIKAIQAKEQTMRDNGGLAQQGEALEQMMRVAQLNMEICQTMKEQVDAIFGADTCRKVFGDIVPGTADFAEFFDAIRPYYEQYAKSRIRQYSPDRTGNV